MLGYLTFNAGLAQSRFPLRYLADIGSLGISERGDKRKFVDLGVARAYPDGEDVVRLEGRDREGKPWRVWTPQIGGLGWTEVWSADFDANGQQDLLIGAHFPGNGSCVNDADLVVLLFGADGRPIPWRVSTQIPAGGEFPFIPAIILDADKNGRAEIVTTSCDRRVTGVWQALNARWMPIAQVAAAPYVSAAKASDRSGGHSIYWPPPKPIQCDDPMRGLNSFASVRVTRLITGELGCGGIRLSVRNGRVAADVDDPCRTRVDDRIEYSDGRISSGWPLVVINGPEGRDIYVARNDVGLRRILRGSHVCGLVGSEAAPAWVWAHADSASPPPGRVLARLVATQVSRKAVVFREGPPPTSGIDAYLEQGRACFSLRLNAKVPEVFVSQGCPYPEKFRKAGIHAGQLRIRESMAWQALPPERELRLWRSEDVGLIATLRFEAPAGDDMALVGVTELGSYWLAEWNGNHGHLLALHDGNGRLIDNIERATVEGELFSSDSYDGLYLLRWSNGRPRELIQVRAAVEWSVAR